MKPLFQLFQQPLVAFALCGALLALCVAPLSAPAADLERGKTLYRQICVNCHGPTLAGGQGPSLVDAYWQHGSSPQAILEVINKGVPGTAMIPYELVFPEADRLAMRDYILTHQEGMRETVRSDYPRSFFKGKRLTPELFDGVESDSQKALPENVVYGERNLDAVIRVRSKLHLTTPGDYRFAVRPLGRTAIFLNGTEVHYSDDKAAKANKGGKEKLVNLSVPLKAGVHDLEILHEEKTSHSYRFHATLHRSGSDKRIALTGRSLEGSVPRVLRGAPQQPPKVVRKWIKDLPPRTLLCLLPNRVIVAYNAADGSVLKAWHSAEVNQTPSLQARSQAPSVLNGTEITEDLPEGLEAEHLQFRHYEIKGDTIRIHSLADDQARTVVLASEGEQSFRLTIEGGTR